jgi:hypothetical protein
VIVLNTRIDGIKFGVDCLLRARRSSVTLIQHEACPCVRRDAPRCTCCRYPRSSRKLWDHALKEKAGQSRLVAAVKRWNIHSDQFTTMLRSIRVNVEQYQ